MKETNEKVVRDTSCLGSGGVPQSWGIRGLIESISAVSVDLKKVDEESLIVYKISGWKGMRTQASA